MITPTGTLYPSLEKKLNFDVKEEEE